MKLLPKLLILTATCVPLVVSCSETKEAVAATAGEVTREGAVTRDGAATVAGDIKDGADKVVGQATESRSIAVNITGMK